MNGFKCKEGNLRLDTRKKFFTVGVGGIETEKLWMQHLWKCSNPDWMGL